jgi:hypothetical protein
MSRKKWESDAAMLERWQAGSVKGWDYSRLMDAGWEAGQVACVTIEGLNYEKFAVSGGYVVVEWDDDGNITVI